MDKSTYLILLLLCSIGSLAQNERIPIFGNIKSDEKDLKDIHIINLSSKTGTITNTDGQFSIWVKNKDTLVFRGIQFESKEIIITKTDIENKLIHIVLITRTNVLKEVNIKKPENMAMALNLPNPGKKPLKGVDLKLAYYSQKSTPIVILEMLLGKQGGIDNLYNIITGNRKKHRKLKKIIDDNKLLEHNKKVFDQIRKYFKDDFFIYTLKISSKKIGDFIKYCRPKNIINLYNNESYLEITDIFIKESKIYLKNNR